MHFSEKKMIRSLKNCVCQIYNRIFDFVKFRLRYSPYLCKSRTESCFKLEVKNRFGHHDKDVLSIPRARISLQVSDSNLTNYCIL